MQKIQLLLLVAVLLLSGCSEKHFITDDAYRSQVEKDFQETLKKSCKVTASDSGNTGIFMRICGRVLRLIAPLM